jgi:excisionase family DNA binding protein
MERKIDAPTKDWLTKDEAAAYLGIKTDSFQTLVDKGLIRGARKWTHRIKMWPWKALVIFSWEMEMGMIDPKILPGDEGE